MVPDQLTNEADPDASPSTRSADTRARDMRAGPWVVPHVRKHDLVMGEPEPVVRLHEISHTATKLICRPWVKTEDYWRVT